MPGMVGPACLMPTDYSGAIVLQNNLQRAMIELSYAPTFSAVQTFASVLHTLTTADICKLTWTQSDNPQLTGGGGGYDDLAFAAHFKLRRTDPTADVRFRSFRLPAPKSEMFEHIPERGYRIKTEYGETLAEAFSTLFGEEFVFDSGWLVN